MKAFILLAVLAVAYAIPMSDNQAESIEDVAGPIPFEMLRNAAAFPSPVWKTFDIKSFDMDNENLVKIVDVVKDILAKAKQVPTDIEDSEVETVYANEPADESDADEQLRIVKFVDNPAEDVFGAKESVVGDVEDILPIADILNAEKVQIVDTPLSESETYQNEELAAPDVENELRSVNFVDTPAQ